MQLELREFNVSPATHIVSLGDACATAHHLRRHFDFAGAFPFDWWITTHVDGLVSFLGAPDVDAVYDPSRLELTAGAGSVRHRDFGFWLHHEFPRRWNLPNRPIREDWRELCEHPKQRTKALMAKFLGLNASGNRVAFVREGTTPASLIDRVDALFPLPDWTLISLTGLNQPSLGWKGDGAAWDAALGALGLKLDRTGHRPYLPKQSEPDVDSRAVN